MSKISLQLNSLILKSWKDEKFSGNIDEHSNEYVPSFQKPALDYGHDPTQITKIFLKSL